MSDIESLRRIVEGLKTDLDHAKAEIARLRAAAKGSRWIKDVDNAPCHKLLIVWGSGGVRTAIRDEHDNWRARVGSPIRIKPTKYMLVPGDEE